MLDAKDMNHVEKWQKSIKPSNSKYTKSVPHWNLIPDSKKVQIGRLTNENIKQGLYKIGSKKYKLSNTCAVDTVIQLIATAIAYYPTYRCSIRNENDGIFQIAKAVAAKYDFCILMNLYCKEIKNLIFFSAKI